MLHVGSMSTASRPVFTTSCAAQAAQNSTAHRAIMLGNVVTRSLHKDVLRSELLLRVLIANTTAMHAAKTCSANPRALAQPRTSARSRGILEFHVTGCHISCACLMH